MFNSDLPTVSFCEGVYNGGQLEILNVISSLFFVVVGVWHLYNIGNDYELVPICLETVLVGIGSVLFHSIPKRIFQMTDELPMILLIISSIKLMHHHMYLYRRYNRNLYYFLYFCVDVMLCCVVIFNVFSMYFLVFEVMYIVMILVYVCMVLWGNWEMRRDVMKVVGIGVFAFLFWLIDQHLCNWFLGKFSLHFFWHLGMSLVVYNFVVFYRVIKLQHNNKRVNVKHWGPFYRFETNGYIEFEDEL